MKIFPAGRIFRKDEVRAGRSDDEDLVCIVENNACGVDAIQLVAEHRPRVRDGKFVCMPCAGEYGRGW